MGFSNVKHNLLAICFCILLIMQPIVAIPPQELYGEPGQEHTFIFCLISFLMGTALYALIYKYFSRPSIVQPLVHETPSPIIIGEHRLQKKHQNKEMNPTQQLQAQMQTIKARQEKTNSATTETKKVIDILLMAFCFFTYQTTMAREKNQQLLQKVLTTQHKDCTIMPTALFTCCAIALNQQKIRIQEQAKHIKTQSLLIVELQKNNINHQNNSLTN